MDEIEQDPIYMSHELLLLHRSFDHWRNQTENLFDFKDARLMISIQE